MKIQVFMEEDLLLALGNKFLAYKERKTDKKKKKKYGREREREKGNKIPF
jgi:hypothetical protein